MRERETGSSREGRGGDGSVTVGRENAVRLGKGVCLGRVVDRENRCGTREAKGNEGYWLWLDRQSVAAG